MTRKTKAISDEMFEACKAELKIQGIRGENGRRLQAIISAKEHGILQVAKIYNISRETLMRWIRKFQEGGSKAFAVDAGRGRRYKLTEQQKLTVSKYIEKEGFNLSSKKLQDFIKNNFLIELSIATAHRLLKSLGFSYITPRPIHHKQDQKTHNEFKKKSGE